MTLNGGNAPLAKENKNSGAHQKNFNEDRPMLSAAKCIGLAVYFPQTCGCSRGFHHSGRHVGFSHLYLRQIVLFDRINCYETPPLSVRVSILISETIPACTCIARIAYM